MKGHPKYQIGEYVQFTIGGEIYDGTVAIVDAYGTFENPSDVSYDIMVPDSDGAMTLYKHVTESLIR